MSPLIQCQHVDFGYDNQDAVIDVNMEVDPGIICVSWVRTAPARVL